MNSALLHRSTRLPRLSRRASLPALAIAPGALAACGDTRPAPDNPPAAPDREVILGVSRDLANGVEDPYFTHASAMVWEPLVGLDDSLRPIPVLAERWDMSPDALTWTFKLRPGVKFSDGLAFDADVVLANMKRYAQISPRTSPYYTYDTRVGYGQLHDVRKVDGLTVTYHFGAPAPLLPYKMALYFSAMQHPQTFADNGDFKGLPVCTGPFKVSEFKRGEYMLLERNDLYWGARPFVRRLKLRTIADPTARVSALLAKEIDGVIDRGAVLPAQIQQLKAQPGITVGADPIARTQLLAFNCARPPFEDVRLRQAVALATDRDSIVKDLMLGHAQPGKSVIAPVSAPWFSPRGAPRYDLAEARRLAASALGNRRVEASLLYNATEGPSYPYKSTAELLQSVLRPLGIDVQIHALESAVNNDRTNRGEWDLRFTSAAWANGDPDYLYDRLLRSGGPAQTTQRGGYRSAEMDSLIAEASVERDERRRADMNGRIQELALQDMPILPLYHELAPWAHRESISGLRHRTTWQPTLDLIKLRA